MTNHQPAVIVEKLQKTYGPIEAVKGIDFTVGTGEIFGMVGPNGAGKTTTIECIEGLRRADAGRIEVLGLDPSRQLQALKPRIGVQLQQSTLQEHLRVGEALALYAAFYGVSVDAKSLLMRLDLAGTERQFFSKLSGGQKQRLFIALALLHGPELLFLDELTTGLDPQARRNMWGLVHQLRDEGRTIYLTTHFMEEAERLCDRVAIVDQGRLIALDSPQTLIDKLGGDRRLLFDAAPFDNTLLDTLPSVTRWHRDGDIVTVMGKTDQMVADVVTRLVENGIGFRHLRTQQSNLEDVFLAVTGHEMESEATA